MRPNALHKLMLSVLEHVWIKQSKQSQAINKYTGANYPNIFKCDMLEYQKERKSNCIVFYGLFTSDHWSFIKKQVNPLCQSEQQNISFR